MASLYSGIPHRVDYTPASAATAGDVVVLGDIVGIVPGDIEADQKSAIDVGGAVYTIAKEASVAYSQGDVLYWDASGETVTATATGNNRMGYAAGDALAADTECRLYHNPGPATA